MDVSSALLFWHFFCAGSLKTLLQGCEHRCINWLYSNTQCSCTPVNVISWYNFHMETLLLYFFIFLGHPIYYIFWKVELAHITVSNKDHVFNTGSYCEVLSFLRGERLMEMTWTAPECHHVQAHLHLKIWRYMMTYMMTSGASKQSSLIASPTVFPLPKSSKSFWATSVLTQCSLQLSNKRHF